MIGIFIDGKRTEIEIDKIDRQIILAHSGRFDGLVLMLRDDGPDEVLGNEWVPIIGGERFETLPHGVIGG